MVVYSSLCLQSTLTLMVKTKRMEYASQGCRRGYASMWPDELSTFPSKDRLGLAILSCEVLVPILSLGSLDSVTNL